MLVNYNLQFAKKNKDRYAKTAPFPHIVLDNFFCDKTLSQVYDSFPNPKELTWHKYNNQLEKKLMYSQVDNLTEPFRKLFQELHKKEFIQFLEQLTGFENIVCDENYTGGGLHQIERGGKLDIHTDFNVLYGTNKKRCLNLILYLNKEWKEEYGGHFEMWDKDVKCCVQKILPIFNRAVIFSTNEYSFHGHPDPLNCPDNMTRKSFALYYYVESETDERSYSTRFVKRPSDAEDEELDKFRLLRSIPWSKRK